MDRTTIKNALEEIMYTIHNQLTFPAIALTVNTIIEQFKYRHHQSPHIDLIKEIAQTELGWEFRILSDRYAQGPALVKVLEPNLNTLREELKKSIERGYTKIRLLKNYGMQAAFNQYHITYDPEGIISETTWTSIFDELGYIYSFGNEFLIPKPLDLPLDIRKQILEVLADLPDWFCQPSKRTNYERVKVISERFLREKLSDTLGIDLGKHQWETLQEGILGEILILQGYSLDKEWIYKTETEPPLKEQGFIFLPAQIIRPSSEKESELATGFQFYMPAAITDGTTLVYLELLGPRQAVKANWAAIRSGRAIHLYGEGTISTEKEDGFITLKTTLRECGWDHWCLIHGQASCEKMVPEQHFYVIEKGEASIPSNFYAQLAKAAPFPVLSHWSEYLWVLGQMNGLITALGGTGLGGWKIFFVKEKWEEIVSRGLKEGKIKINNSVPLAKINRKSPAQGDELLIERGTKTSEEPFFHLFKHSLYPPSGGDEQQLTQLVNLTQQVCLLIEKETKIVNFWESIPARNRLKTLIQKCFLSPQFMKIPGLLQKRTHLINRIMELAEKHNDFGTKQAEEEDRGKIKGSQS